MIHFKEDLVKDETSDAWIMTDAKHFLIDQCRRDIFVCASWITEKADQQVYDSFELESDLNIEYMFLVSECECSKHLLMRLKEGFTVKEIAEELGLKVRAINKRITKLKEEYKRRIGNIPIPK